MQESKAVISFYLEAVDGAPLPPYQPGQHLLFKLNLPGSEIPLFRHYSFSEAYRPDYYRISVKKESIAGSLPGSCSCFLHDSVSEGDIVEGRGPLGSFVLDGGNDPVVLIAGGIGITPLLSMAKSLPTLYPGREAFLYYGVNGKEEHSFREELNGLIRAYPRLQVFTFYNQVQGSDRQGGDYQFEGLITARQILQHTGRTDIAHYICGPSAMMQALREEFTLLGVSEKKVHSESFVTELRIDTAESETEMVSEAAAPPVAPQQKSDSATAAAWKIRFAGSDRALDWDSRFRSILEFAEANDVEISSGCLFGDCGTCMTTLISGEVKYTHPTMVEPDPGTCLPCSCVPTSDIVLDA